MKSVQLILNQPNKTDLILSNQIVLRKLLLLHACIMHGQLFLLLRCNFKDVFELHLGIIDGATSHVMTLCVRLSHEF